MPDVLAGIHLFKVRKGNTKTMGKICSKLTRNTLERCQTDCTGSYPSSSKEIFTLPNLLINYEELPKGPVTFNIFC